MIRGATPRDYPTFATLFRELEIDDPTPSAERWASELVHDTLISERAGKITGYVTFIALSEAGHVRNLVVAPAARGTGVGRELMNAVAELLRARGIAEWHLNVKVDNAPAIRLYEQLGLRVEHRSQALRFAWARVAELPGDPAPVTVLPVAPDEDDDVERALGLLSGRLEMARSRAGVVILQLRDAELAPVGVASFDPAFPGAVPFKVARPALARPLLDALAPYARPGDLDLQIVIEDDDALGDALLAAGAELRLRLLHYAGALPA